MKYIYSNYTLSHYQSQLVPVSHCQSLAVTACLWQSPLVTAGL